jgi:hypothetical protein
MNRLVSTLVLAFTSFFVAGSIACSGNAYCAGGSSGGSCACPKGEKCDITCDGDACNTDCAEGATCIVKCKGNCQLTCGTNATCDQTCGTGSCSITVTAAKSATQKCGSATECQMTCTGSGCSQIKGTAAASCAGPGCPNGGVPTGLPTGVPTGVPMMPDMTDPE